MDALQTLLELAPLGFIALIAILFYFLAMGWYYLSEIIKGNNPFKHDYE